MPRSSRPGPEARSPEWRHRISKGLVRWHARRREMSLVAPSELLELERAGTVSPSLKPYAAQAIEEADELARALGGVDDLSPQRLVLIQDAARVGLVLRAMVARFMQGEGDPELASKVSTMASTRRSLLTALGLEREAKELDLAGYLAAKSAENRPHGTNGGGADQHEAGDAEVSAKPNAGVTPETVALEGEALEDKEKS